MRVLLTGGSGMLARAVAAELAGRGHPAVSLPREALDVTREDAVRAVLRREQPAVVFQGAAYTAVDLAESEPERARLVNVEATRHVARECQTIGALFVYPSTDYVFSGRQRRPWRPEDEPEPINAYGRSKLAGERAAMEAGPALVVRTGWLYGSGGANFVDTISALARQRSFVEVVDDQIGRPTWTVSLARVVVDLMEGGVTGILHASDAGEPVSWYGFAREIIARQRLASRVISIASDVYPRPAARPSYSVLDCSATEALIGRALPDWSAMLSCYLGGHSHAGGVSGRVSAAAVDATCTSGPDGAR